MTQTIDLARIRPLAEAKGITSAKDLARRLGIKGERTAYRLWGGKGRVRLRAVRTERLAHVLGVDVAVLTGEAPMPAAARPDPQLQQHKELFRLFYADVNAPPVPREIYNALALNTVRYGVSLGTQIELAALLFHIVAQRSLRHRRETLAAIEQERERLNALSRERAAHLPIPARGTDIAEEVITAEQRSIEQEDVFTTSDAFADIFSVDYDDLEQRNPLAEEVRRLAAGLPDIEDEVEITKARLSYTINRSQAEKLCGGDEELADELLSGHMRLAGLGGLVGEDKTTERVAELRRRRDKYWAEWERCFGKRQVADSDPEF